MKEKIVERKRRKEREKTNDHQMKEVSNRHNVCFNSDKPRGLVLALSSSVGNVKKAVVNNRNVRPSAPIASSCVANSEFEKMLQQFRFRGGSCQKVTGNAPSTHAVESLQAGCGVNASVNGNSIPCFSALRQKKRPRDLLADRVNQAKLKKPCTDTLPKARVVSKYFQKPLENNETNHLDMTSSHQVFGCFQKPLTSHIGAHVDLTVTRKVSPYFQKPSTQAGVGLEAGCGASDPVSRNKSSTSSKCSDFERMIEQFRYRGGSFKKFSSRVSSEKEQEKVSVDASSTHGLEGLQAGCGVNAPVNSNSSPCVAVMRQKQRPIDLLAETVTQAKLKKPCIDTLPKARVVSKYFQKSSECNERGHLDLSSASQVLGSLQKPSTSHKDIEEPAACKVSMNKAPTKRVKSAVLKTTANKVNVARLRKKRNKQSIYWSVSERRNDAYKRKAPDNTWVPPRSDIVLLQEDHIHDPWRVLVICILLSRTNGNQVCPTIPAFFNLIPNAEAAADVRREDLFEVMKSLGLHKRINIIKAFSYEYLHKNWTYVHELYGIGRYAADAYALFCTGMWDKIKRPPDKELVKYWNFLRSQS